MSWALGETMGYGRTRGLAAFVSWVPAQGLVPSQCLLVEAGSTVLKCLEEKLHLNLVLKEKEKMVIWGRNSVYPHFLSLSLLL